LALSAGQKTLVADEATSPWSVSGLVGASILSPQENGSGLTVSNKQSAGFSLSLDYLWREKFLFSGFYLDAGAAEVTGGPGVLGDLGYQYYGGSLSWLPFSARNVISPYLKGGVHTTQHSVTDPRIKFDQNLQLNAHVGLGAEWKFSNDWRLLVDMTSYGKDAFVASAGLRYQLFNPSKPQPEIKPQPEPKPQVKIIPPTDSDDDGVYNSVDLCADTPIGLAVDDDGCQIRKTTAVQSRESLPDGDGDGILDKQDCCPNTALGKSVDGDGCALIEIDLSRSAVPFEFASAELSEVGEKIWSKIAAQIQQFPNVVVELSGHTDSKGTDEFNQRLSLKRSQSVQRFLMAHGVHADQLRIKAYGESAPIASNDLDEGRSQNRRVEAHLVQALKQVSVDDDLPESCKNNSQDLSLDKVETSFEAYGFQLLSESAKQAWEKVADRLIDSPDLHAELAGYTDSSGSEELNQQLAQQRAESVRDYLISLGVDGDRLTATGYGESDPIADNSTAEGRKANRRVELHLF
ncbi:MAG: OmpA family protein, partial [Gammaproteobacteria bacterium]|nr:OmpA family protein [Gammaproteobacteria bacterium]